MTVRRVGVFCGIVLLAALTGSAASARTQAVRSPKDGIYTAAQATRGATLYAENCAACHSADLSGTEIAPPLTAATLTSGRWRNKRLGDFFELMRQTMPFNSPGGLSAQQNADLLAFILQRAEFPAGTTDLPSRSEALNTYMFPSPR